MLCSYSIGCNFNTWGCGPLSTPTGVILTPQFLQCTVSILPCPSLFYCPDFDFHTFVWWFDVIIQSCYWSSPGVCALRIISLNKKEWICSLFKEWILEKSEIRVNLEWIWCEHLCYSLILEWPQGSLRDSESWSLRSLQNEWITQMFTPNSL